MSLRRELLTDDDLASLSWAVGGASPSSLLIRAATDIALRHRRDAWTAGFSYARMTYDGVQLGELSDCPYLEET